MQSITDNYTNNIDNMFEKIDNSNKNPIINPIPLQERRNMLRNVMSRFQNLDDFPTQVSHLFSGNASRLHHVLFNDVTEKYNGVKTPIDLVRDHIQQNNKDKRGKVKGCLTIEQENILIEYHKFAFVTKLGIEVLKSSTSSTAISMKSKTLMEV